MYSVFRFTRLQLLRHACKDSFRDAALHSLDQLRLVVAESQLGRAVDVKTACKKRGDGPSRGPQLRLQ